MIHGLPTRCRHALYDDHKDLSIVEIMYWHGPLNQKGTVVKKKCTGLATEKDDLMPLLGLLQLQSPYL